MEFGKHLPKGIWGGADKALPVIYGIGYVLLVVRILPMEEYGNYVLFQDIFLIVSGLALALALQPLIKFAAEENVRLASVVTTAVMFYSAFLALATTLVVLIRDPLGALFKSEALPTLILYLPLMVVAAHPRNIALSLLQANLKIKEVFWVDAVHFLGAPLLVWVWSRLYKFDSAVNLIMITTVSQAFSSLLGLQLARRYMRLTRSPDKQDLRAVWQYGKYTLGSSLSGFVGSKADTFILSAFAGVSQLALYNSVKVFIRAYDMMSQVVQMFIVPASSKFSSRGDTTSLVVLVEKGILFASIVMFPLFLVYGFLAQPLVEILYHGKYLEAIPILRILAIPALFVPAMAVAGTALLGLGRARAMFWIGVQSVFLSLATYLLFIPWLGAIGAAWACTIASAIMTLISLAALRKAVPYTARGVMSRFKDLSTFLKRHLHQNNT